MNYLEKQISFPRDAEFKPSGFDWLGQIPKHWELTSLGKSLSEISIKNRSDLPLLSITRERGVIVRSLEDDEDNHNFIPDDLSNYKVLQEGQFGMNKMKAWQGSYGIATQTGIVSPAYYVFELDENIDRHFFHLAIRSKAYVSFFAAASDGVRIGQWDLSKNRMKQIPFLLPPKNEQTRIAQFLDRKTAQIDKAIAQKEKLIELLKERRQILIHNAVTRGLNPNVKMKDSGVEWIGEVPEHWDFCKLGFYLDILSGYAFPSSGFSEEGVRLLRGVNVGVKSIRWDEVVFWPTERTQDLQAFFLSEGDIVFGMDRPLVSNGMRIASIEKKDLPCLLLQRVTRIRPIDNLSREYLMTILDSKPFADYFSPILSGVSVPHISPDQIKSFKIAMPSISEQKDIVDYLEQESLKTSESIVLSHKQIERLKEYKATLINSAVTGKIKV